MSMNKKTRSLINTRYEAQKIYYQRKEIKRKDKEIEELNNVKEFYKRKALDYKNCLKRISEKINFYKTTEWGIKSISILQEFENILQNGSENDE